MGGQAWERITFLLENGLIDWSKMGLLQVAFCIMILNDRGSRSSGLSSDGILVCRDSRSSSFESTVLCAHQQIRLSYFPSIVFYDQRRFRSSQTSFVTSSASLVSYIVYSHPLRYLVKEIRYVSFQPLWTDEAETAPWIQGLRLD
jgi:hypothetical protein